MGIKGENMGQCLTPSVAHSGSLLPTWWPSVFIYSLFSQSLAHNEHLRFVGSWTEKGSHCSPKSQWHTACRSAALWSRLEPRVNYGSFVEHHAAGKMYGARQNPCSYPTHVHTQAGHARQTLLVHILVPSLPPPPCSPGWRQVGDGGEPGSKLKTRDLRSLSFLLHFVRWGMNRNVNSV